MMNADTVSHGLRWSLYCKHTAPSGSCALSQTVDHRDVGCLSHCSSLFLNNFQNTSDRLPLALTLSPLQHSCASFAFGCKVICLHQCDQHQCNQLSAPDMSCTGAHRDVVNIIWWINEYLIFHTDRKSLLQVSVWSDDDRVLKLFAIRFSIYCPSVVTMTNCNTALHLSN